MMLPNERSGVDAGWRVLFAFQRPRPRATQAERSAKVLRNLGVKCRKYMKTKLTISVLAALFVITATTCLAAREICLVSKQQAKEWGIEIHTTSNGPKEIWIELQFKADAKFKEFGHVELETSEVSYAPLKEERSGSNVITVRFLAKRARIDNITLVIVAGNPENYTGYHLGLKDFVEPETVR